MDKMFECKNCCGAFLFNVKTQHPTYCPICLKKKQVEQSRKHSLAYYHRKTKQLKCPTCGGAISPMTLKRGGMCAKCRIPHPWTRAKGNKSGRWRGGRSLTPNGYIYKYAPEHPDAIKSKGYVMEHRLVWEQTYGKRLPKDWVVHHINGIRDDNRPQNLYACHRKDHTGMNFLKILQTRIRSLEKELLQNIFNNHLL